jgi:glycosyltransferase involved in cell wall biosynthesis
VSRLRVLYSFPTRLGTPGIGSIAWQQVTGLVEQGVEVTVACGSCERPLPGAHRVVETLRVGPAKIPYRALGFERAVALHDRLVARMIARGPAPDVVHAWPLGAERTLTAARQAGALALLERPNAHTAFAFEAVARECERLGLSVDKTSPHLFDAGRLAREEREYAAADRLLCPSEFVADTFRDRGYAERDILRHRYGFDPSRFFPAANGGERPFTVVFVGRGEARKGLHMALRAWLDSGLGDSGRFVICGPIDPDYRSLLEPLLAHPSVDARGNVSDPADTMRRADVLVLPSMEEGSALVTYEGRACGCVLAVSDRSGAVADHGRDALVHRAGDVRALRDHLRSLARDPGLLARLRAAGIERSADLTWSAAGRRLREAYGEGLDAAAASAGR